MTMPDPFLDVRTGPGSPGAIATPHKAATRAGQQVLDSGGNAVDAVIAAAAVLAVVYPNQCTIGGDAVALVATPDGRRTVVNGTGRSPSALDVGAIRAAHSAMPAIGALSVTVPGVISTWEAMADHWGTRPLAAALTHAATLAEQGVTIAPGLARSLRTRLELLRADEGCASILLRDGELPADGSLLRQPQLARTLRTLATDGPAALYGGPIGECVVRTLRAKGSPISMTDFREHSALIGEADVVTCGGLEFATSGDNTQGPYFRLGLAVLERIRAETGVVPDGLGADAGLVAEVLAVAAAARDGRAGIEALDTPSFAVTDAVVDLAWSLARRGGQRFPLQPVRLGDTVAVACVDASGTGVVLIQSTFNAFGSCVLDPDTGVLLHNRGAAFDLDPSSKNALGAGIRPPHTLMPVVVSREGRVIAAHGTMGGPGQPQTQTHLALSQLAGQPAAVSVSRPRWVLKQATGEPHAAAGYRMISAESDLAPEARSSLADAGFEMHWLPPRSDLVGHAQVVRVQADGGFDVGTDPRADGAS